MPPQNVYDWIGWQSQIPIAKVKVNGKDALNIMSVDVTFGIEQQSSSASIRLPASTYPRNAIGANVVILMGYGGPGGGLIKVFEGEIEDVDTKFMPYFLDIKCAGFLKRAQRQAGNTDPLSGSDTPVKEWSGATDSQIWQDLMKLGNVPKFTSGSGDGRTIGGPVKLMPGDNIRSKIDELDHASESGQRTYEWAGQVYRTPALRIPAGTPSWRYKEGQPSFGELVPAWTMHSLSRQQTDRDVKNQCVVQGVQRSGDENADVVGAVVQAYSPFWGKDGNGNDIFVPFSFQSDYLETRPQCEAVAQRYMIEHNKITDVVEMRTTLNPFAMPARTVGITSARMGLPAQTNYLVRQISHHWGQEGATTDWTLEGGTGTGGYLVGLPPIALFDMKVTMEVWQEGTYATPVPHYTAACNGSGSFDQDRTALTYAWSASNGATGSGVNFTTVFSQAQMDDIDNPPKITLVVTDHDTPDPHTSEPNEQYVGTTDSIDLIAMYVAALGICHATPDGWLTTNSWTPPANALCTCRIVSDGTNYFGLANGQVYRTADYLATAPTLVWTSPGGSPVTAMWQSEIDPRVVAIGLANGDFWLTLNNFTTPPVLKRTFDGPIQWINGSDQVLSQWRACVGMNVWYTDNHFVGARVLMWAEGQTFTQNELTDFANYGIARNGTAWVRNELDSHAFEYPAGLTPLPTDVSATAFIDTDDLLICDNLGRSFFSSPASLGTRLVQRGDVGAGAVNDVLRDNVNYASAYAACDLGLAKTFDKGQTWHRVLNYNGTSTRAVMIGYDPAPPPLPVISGGLVEAVFFGSSKGGTEPQNGAIDGGMDYPIGDDADGEGKYVMDLWNPSLSPDADGARNAAPPANWYTPGFVMSDYSPAGFTHVWQHGTTGIVPIHTRYPVPYDSSAGNLSGRQLIDRAYSGWVRSQTLGHSGPSGYPDTIGGSDVSAWTPPGSGRHPEWLIRHKFVLPAMSVQRAIFTWYSENLNSEYLLQYDPDVYIEELWVNGVAYGASHTYAGIQLDPSILVADGVSETLVAVRVRQRSLNGWPLFSYKLSCGPLAGSVSMLINPVNEGLIWGSSAESSFDVYQLTYTAEPYRPLPSNWYNPVGAGPLPIGGAVSGFTGYVTPYYAVGSAAVDHVGLYASPWPAYEEHGFKLANLIGHRMAMDLDADASTVYKQAADFPAGEIKPWRLYIRKRYPNELIISDIYINGTRLSTGTPASPAGDTGNNYTVRAPNVVVYSWDVPAGTIVMGARNTIAIRTKLTVGSSYLWGMAWYLEQIVDA